MADNQKIAIQVDLFIAQYISGKSKLPICIDTNGSITISLPISKYSLFGEIIYEKLEPATSHKKKSANLYILLPKKINQQRKTKGDTRSTKLVLSPQSTLMIKKFFREMLEVELVAMIEAASFVYEEIKGVKKGIFHKVIHLFMKKYNMEGNRTTFETLKKIGQRSKKRSQTAKTLML